MTTTSTSTDWIREGAEVAEFNGRGYDPSVVAISTIDRLTATQIVLANGQRYNRTKLTRVGADHYKSPKLLPVNDQQVRDTQARQHFSRIVNDIYMQGREFRGGEAAVLTALDEIEQAVREARAAIHANPADTYDARRSADQAQPSGTAERR